jgi:hypothetical protein
MTATPQHKEHAMTRSRVDRRRLLAGAVTLPAGALAASPALSAAINPDARLLNLAQLHAQTGSRLNSLWAELEGQPSDVQRDAEAKSDALCDRYYAQETALFAERATTPEGLRAKARVVLHILGDEPDGTYGDHLTRNLLADLLREA